MEEKVILYTTHCPRCKVLAMKLDQARIKYTECEDVRVMLSKGLTQAPGLGVGDMLMDFAAAIKWINERGNQVMQIEFKLNKDFERFLEELRKKYGEDFEYLNGIHPSQLDDSSFIDHFEDGAVLADVSSDPNANASHKDIRSFMTEKGKGRDKLFALSKIFYEMKKKWGLRTAKEWFEREFNKGFYLNDSHTSSFYPYCWANDLTRLATEGLFFLNNYHNEAPAHLTTFIDDTIEFVSFLSNRQSGAVGLPNIIIWCYYFWKHDIENDYYIKNPEYYLKQNFQKLIFRLNQPFLRIDQSSFTNISIFDRCYLESMFGGVVFPDGSMAIDQIEEIIKCQKTFMEVVSETREINMFTYPVLTYSLLKKPGITEADFERMKKEGHFDIFVDEEFARWCSDHNWKWNDSNFFMSTDVGTLSNCCRLLSSTNKLDAFINSIGGTALSIGSCRVSTINLVRIAYESKINKRKYLDILKNVVILDCKALYTMRHIIARNIEKGLLPNYCEGGVELSKQYCTIGILGMYEVMDLFGYIRTDEFGNKFYTPEAMEFATEIFKVINEVKDNFTDEFSYNIESIPGENCAGVICAADNLLYEQNRYYIYSNQWIPLKEHCTIQEKCRVSAILDNECSGGAISHINLETRFPDKDGAWTMLNYIASTGVIYMAFTSKIHVCKNRHAFIGTAVCPICGEPIADTYRRVVGFYTPESSYQKIRRKEASERKDYNPEKDWYDILSKDSIL